MDAPVLDLRGLRCPLPVLKAAKRLDAMRPGERLWVETTDPLATLDMPAFATESGHSLLKTERTEWGHRFLFERAPFLSLRRGSERRTAIDNSLSIAVAQGWIGEAETEWGNHQEVATTLSGFSADRPPLRPCGAPLPRSTG